MLSSLWSVATSPYRCVRYYTCQKHDLPFARPDRTPPDPAFFPRYIQNKQGMWLHFVEFPPLSAPKPKGVIFLVMGLGEHAGRYDSVALRLNDEGYYVFIMDNQGHGASEGERKYVESFSDYIDDVQLFVKTMFAKHPELALLPRFIMGHSMGGLITTLTAYRDPKYWNGVILSGPAIEPSVEVPGFVQSAAGFLANFLPKISVANLDVDLINSNPRVVEFAKQDPLYSKEMLKLRFVVELYKATTEAHTNVDKSNFPLLIVHGTADGLCNPKGSQWLLEHCVSSDKVLKMYPGLYHEVLTEPKREEVLKDIFAFLESHLGKKASK